MRLYPKNPLFPGVKTPSTSANHHDPSTGFTLMLPQLYGGFGPLAASPEPSDGAASAGTGPSGLGSKFCAIRACLCRAKRQPGQGGDNVPPPRSFTHPGTNSLARPSSAITTLPSQKNPP